MHPGKRWAATAERDGDRFRIGRTERVGNTEALLRRLGERAGGETSVAGFDFPIGVPRSWAKRAGVASFRELLPQLGRGRWERFFDVATTPGEIALERPFYPRRPGGTSQAHLVDGLGVEAMSQLLRRCERARAGRRAACALFWTVGGNQVGKGALSGWREVLMPAVDAIRLWPFDGAFESFVGGATVVVETYPAEAAAQMRLRGGKTSSLDRAANAPVLHEVAEQVGAVFDSELEEEADRGFSDDDRYDAVLGLLGMLGVLRGLRPSGEPRDDPDVFGVEGWIFGQLA